MARHQRNEGGAVQAASMEATGYRRRKRRSRREQDGAYPFFYFVLGIIGKAGIMFDWIMENFWIFLIIMLVVLAALVGVLLFLRSRRPED